MQIFSVLVTQQAIVWKNIYKAERQRKCYEAEFAIEVYIDYNSLTSHSK